MRRIPALRSLRAAGWALAMLGAASCAPARGRLSLVVAFDVEDYISPAAEGIDDIPKRLAEILTEEGATGTFFVIGEKARSLEARGRRDVIEAMARHDIGSHTNFGSVHPTVTEELEKADWAGGTAAMAGQESAGIRDLERIFGVPVTTLSRHGGSYGPQLAAALGAMGAGYVGSPAGLPGHDVVWFCNALNFAPQIDGFDDLYYRDDLFEPRLKKLGEELSGLSGKAEARQLFAGHPTKIRAEEFWDLNFYDGKNPPPEEWRAPALRPRESLETAYKNFRRLIRFLKSRDDIELTTFRELMRRYGGQPDRVSGRDLRDFAARILRAGSLAPGESLSPAEAFAGLAVSLAEYARAGRLPETVAALRPLGPPEMPLSRPEIESVALTDVLDLAGAAASGLLAEGAIPSALEVRGARIGAGSLMALFCSAYAGLAAGAAEPSYRVPEFEPYPRANEAEIVRRVEGYKGWPVHRRDLDMSRIVELTRLQLWTLKPASPD